jgi:DNA-binding transcriptional LysR family regulator
MTAAGGRQFGNGAIENRRRELRAEEYQLIIRDDRLRDPAIKAFRSWILAAAREPLQR